MQRAIQIGRITGTAGPLRRRSPALILISLRGTSRSAPQIEQVSRSSGWSYWASIRMPINELDQKVGRLPTCFRELLRADAKAINHLQDHLYFGARSEKPLAKRLTYTQPKPT